MWVVLVCQVIFFYNVKYEDINYCIHHRLQPNTVHKVKVLDSFLLFQSWVCSSFSCWLCWARGEGHPQDAYAVRACCVRLHKRESTIWIPLCSIHTQVTAVHRQTSVRPHQLHKPCSGSKHTHCFGAQQRKLGTCTVIRS